MSASYDHGPLQEWAITWVDGTVEVIEGHQVILPSTFTFGSEKPNLNITIHGEFDGHRLLVLQAPGDQIRSVRLLRPARAEGSGA